MRVVEFLWWKASIAAVKDHAASIRVDILYNIVQASRWLVVALVTNVYRFKGAVTDRE